MLGLCQGLVRKKRPPKEPHPHYLMMPEPPQRLQFTLRWPVPSQAVQREETVPKGQSGQSWRPAERQVKQLSLPSPPQDEQLRLPSPPQEEHLLSLW